MGKWIYKAAIQRVVGMLPYRDTVHEVLQRHITQSICLNMPAFLDHLRVDSKHLEHYFAINCAETATPRSVFEVGTGWHPIFPLSMWLCGSDEIWTADIVGHLNAERVRDTIDHFLACDQSGELARALPRLIPERVAQLRELSTEHHTTYQELLARVGIKIILSDGQYPAVPDHSVDLIVSNVAMQYVSHGVLPIMCREFWRISTATAVMSHDIDMQDQWSHNDPSISPINFLKFSDSMWRIINNPFVPLNRMRASDYRRAMEDAGFQVEIKPIASAQPRELSRIRIADRFKQYAREEITLLRAWFLCKTSSWCLFGWVFDFVACVC